MELASKMWDTMGIEEWDNGNGLNLDYGHEEL